MEFHNCDSCLQRIHKKYFYLPTNKISMQLQPQGNVITETKNGSLVVKCEIGQEINRLKIDVENRLKESNVVWN